MKAIKFKYCNAEVGKEQKRYSTLPAFVTKDVNGHVIICWKLCLKEKLKILFTGVFWFDQLTFNQSFNPVKFSVYRKDIMEYPEDQLKGFNKLKFHWKEFDIKTKFKTLWEKLSKWISIKLKKNKKYLFKS